MDIADWLRRLGLDQYERAFRDNDVDVETLPSLTAEDLRQLGVTSLGHRRKCLSAITTLIPDVSYGALSGHRTTAGLSPLSEQKRTSSLARISRCGRPTQRGFSMNASKRTSRETASGLPEPVLRRRDVWFVASGRSTQSIQHQAPARSRLIIPG